MINAKIAESGAKRTTNITSGKVTIQRSVPWIPIGSVDYTRQ